MLPVMELPPILDAIVAGMGRMVVLRIGSSPDERVGEVDGFAT